MEQVITVGGKFHAGEIVLANIIYGSVILCDIVVKLVNYGCDIVVKSMMLLYL
jgi:hypothetical protein